MGLYGGQRQTLDGGQILSYYFFPATAASKSALSALSAPRADKTEPTVITTTASTNNQDLFFFIIICISSPVQKKYPNPQSITTFSANCDFAMDPKTTGLKKTKALFDSNNPKTEKSAE